MFLSVVTLSIHGETVQQQAVKINNILNAQYQASKVQPLDIINDDVFVRRAYLSIIGRIPTNAEYTAFIKLQNPQKRPMLVEYLINHPGYTSHLFNFWSESLRLRDRLSPINNFHGGVYIDYIKDLIASNKPYDVFVKSLLLSTGSYFENPATGYYFRDLGMPLDNLIATSKVFLGVDISCAQCHDDPFQDFTQHQFYRMAALFTQVDLNNRGNKEFNEQYRLIREQIDTLIKADPVKNRGLNNRINNFVRATRSEAIIDATRTLKLPHDYQYSDSKPNAIVEPAVLFGKTAVKHKDDLRYDAVEWMVSSTHPTFTKNIVNRYWKWVFGKYIIEGYDNIHSDALLQDKLLVTLAEIFVQENYNIKKFLHILYSTDLFQRSLYNGANAFSEKFVFIGPVQQRLSAEQIWDAVVTLAVDMPESFKVSFHDEYAKVMLEAKSNISLENLQTQYEKYQKVIQSRYEKAAKFKNIPIVRASEINDNSAADTILKQLGRSDRELIDTSSREGSVTQVISFMNGQLAEIATDKTNYLFKLINGKSPSEKLELIFASILSRAPTINEKSLFLNTQDDDIIWALINSSEFRFNK